MVVPVIITNIIITNNIISIVILLFINIILVTIMTIIIPWEETGFQGGEGTGLKKNIKVKVLGRRCPMWPRNASPWLWPHWSSSFERIWPFSKDSFVWLTMKQCSEEGIEPRVQVLLLILSLHWLTLRMTLGNSLPFEAQFLHLANEGVSLDSLCSLSKCYNGLYLLDLVDLYTYVFILFIKCTLKVNKVI